MARRKAKSRPRRRNTAINISNLAEAYIQTSIWTMAATKLSPWNFLMSKENPTGASTVTLKELVQGFNTVHAGTSKTEAEWVWDNIQNGWVAAAIQTVGVGIGFRVANKILAKPKRQLNAFARQLGVGDMVRI